MNIGPVTSAPAAGQYSGAAAANPAEGSPAEEATESAGERTRELAMQSQNGNTFNAVA